MNGQQTQSMIGPQLHMNVIAPTEERIEPITQCAWHPNGGMWTTTNDPDTPAFAFFTATFAYMYRLNETNPRYRAIQGDSPHLPEIRCWILHPSQSARIATIDTKKDLFSLGDRYGWVKCSWEKRMAPLGLVASRPEIENALNFPAIAKDYDAIHVTEAGIELLENIEVGEHRLAFWEAECTCWFRWCFERVEEVGPLSKYMPHKHAPPTEILRRRMRTYAAIGAAPVSLFGAFIPPSESEIEKTLSVWKHVMTKEQHEGFSAWLKGN
jgi:hypothetical protein